MKKLLVAAMAVILGVVLFGCDNEDALVAEKTLEEEVPIVDEEPENERMYFYVCMKWNENWTQTPTATISYFEDVATATDSDREPMFRTLTHPLVHVYGELCFWTAPEKPSRFYYGAWVDVNDENKQAPYRASIVTFDSTTSEIISDRTLQVGSQREAEYHGFPIWDAATPIL